VTHPPPTTGRVQEGRVQGGLAGEPVRPRLGGLIGPRPPTGRRSASPSMVVSWRAGEKTGRTGGPRHEPPRPPIGPPRRDPLSAVDHPAGLGAGLRRPTRGHRRAAGVLRRGAECRRERRGARRAAERSHPPERAPGTAAAHRSGDAPPVSDEGTRRRDSTKGGVSGIRLGDDPSAARPRRRAPLPGGSENPRSVARLPGGEVGRPFFDRRRDPDDERAETLVAEADGVEPADRERAHREEEGTPPFRRRCRSPESWPSGVASERNDRGPRTGRSPLREPARGGGGTLEAEIPTAPASGVGSRAVPSRPTAPAAGGDGAAGCKTTARRTRFFRQVSSDRDRPSTPTRQARGRQATSATARGSFGLRRAGVVSTGGWRIPGLGSWLEAPVACGALRSRGCERPPLHRPRSRRAGSAIDYPAGKGEVRERPNRAHC